MKQPLRPSLKVQIEYGQIDPDARDTAAVTAKTSEMAFSNSAQVINDHSIEENIKVMTLEQNETFLDGSFVFVPVSTITDCKVGFRPDFLSDADGNFSSYPYIQITTTDNINAIGISLVFSKKLKQYAVDFDVVIGNITHSITNNSLIEWQSDFEVNETNVVKIIFKKWCKAFTRAKLTQVNFGIYTIFTNDNLTALKLTDKFNPISTQLSEGSVDFTFVNVGKEYNPMNLSSRRKFIVERQPIVTSVGYDDEMFQVGYHELSGKPTITQRTVELTGSTLLSKLDVEIDATLYQAKTLYQIAQSLFAAAGITKYSIDATLKNYTVTTVIDGTAREALTSLCIAACKQYWQAGDTVYIGVKSATSSNFEITSNIEQNPTITVDDVIQSITVTYKTYALGTTSEQLTTYTPTENGTFVLSVSYATGITVTGGTLVSSTLNSATVTGTANTQITVSGIKLVENELTASYTNSNVDDGSTIKVTDNQFISTATQANTVINWLLAYYANTQIITSKWRQNPALQIGDVIGIATDFGTHNIMIEENTLEMSAGGLSGSTKGRVI